MKKHILAILVFVIILLAGFALYYKWRSGWTPNNVEAEYKSMVSSYGRSMGAGIRLCKKGGDVIYEVWGSGGYTGGSIYFNEKGEEINRSSWSDVIDLDAPAPINPTKGYTCKDLKKSKQ